jgi:hypothetical protein
MKNAAIFDQMAEQVFFVNLIADNIAEVVMKEHIYLDVAVTDAIDKELQRLAPNRKVYQVVIAKGPYIVNPEMRNSMSHGDTGIRQLAMAWVSPDEKANREQEAIVSKLPLPVPIRFFSDRQGALDWFKALSAV